MPDRSAQRLADSLEFLNQVIRGLSGEESGIPIQKVTGGGSRTTIENGGAAQSAIHQQRAQGDWRS